MTIWPAALESGDIVALVSPASKPDPVLLRKGIELLESWELCVELSASEPDGWRAGTDEDRQLCLQGALDDERVRAVLCTRGGFGAARIVEGLSFEALISRAAALVGFSDGTTLHTALDQKLVSFHGPALAWHENNGEEAIGSVAAASLRAALFDRPPEIVRVDENSGTHTLRSGERAVGRLVGGNLSTLASGAGTRSQMSSEGAIVLLEEVDEGHATIDRMLTQLDRSGSLDGAVGFVLGQFWCCDTAEAIDVLRLRLTRYQVPILGGVPVGHGIDQRTVALGANVEIDPQEGTLRYMYDE